MEQALQTPPEDAGLRHVGRGGGQGLSELGSRGKHPGTTVSLGPLPKAMKERGRVLGQGPALYTEDLILGLDH